MSRYLLAVTVGPVQNFIAAARRTRDFWYGSFVLSEISKAVARTLHEQHCDLIFPAPADPNPDLRRGSELNVANVIVAITAEGANPRTLAHLACTAASDQWKLCADEALAELKRLQGAHLVDTGRFEQQVKDVIESYAAWVGFDPATGDYRLKRQRLMRLLAGSKSCRMFAASRETGMGIPKSSLDGSRETLFTAKIKADELPKQLRRSLRLTDGEQLDAIGLTKRLGDGKHPYPSVSRIAIDPWARGCAAKAPEEWEMVVDACKGLGRQGLAPVRGDQFRVFPYEAQLLFEGGLKEFEAELDIDKETRDHIDTLGLALDEIVTKAGKPDEPYLVVLAADGDGIGAALSAVASPADHQAFSRALSRFAGIAKSEIEKHHGCLVYAGGDDILAFVPLDTALECARQLHDSFSKTLETEGGEVITKTPTLSVGLAIGHYLEPLENLLEYARAAEKAAKGLASERNGLAIHYHPRSGAPVLVKGQWRDGIGERMETLTLLHRDDVIGDKAAYDLRELSRLYEGWTECDKTARILQEDVKRLLNRKRGGPLLATEVQGFDVILKTVSNSKRLQLLAEEIIIARQLGRARKMSGWLKGSTV